MREHRSARTALLVLAAALILSGCTSTSTSIAIATATDGDPATWQLADPGAVTADSTSIDVEVSRLGCSSGKTGDLLDPVVSYEADRVTIRIDAAPIGEGIQACPSNDVVPITVALTEPLGQRTLVDGGCGATEAATTMPCLTTERFIALPSP